MNVVNEISRNLAYVGSLSDKEFDLADLGFELMKIIFEKYPNNLKQKFNNDEKIKKELLIEIKEIALYYGITSGS